MDYIYGQLPGIVDEMIYKPLPGNNTTLVQINNAQKTIAVNVLKTPNALTIADTDTLQAFDGSSSVKVNIPRYQIKPTEAPSESTAYRYTLYEYDYTTQEYSIPCGDLEIGYNADVLNIENGLSNDPAIKVNGSVTSADIVIGNNTIRGSKAAGIQSLSFGGADLKNPDVLQTVEIDDFNSVGQSIGKIIVDVIKIEHLATIDKYNITIRNRATSEQAVLVGVRSDQFVIQTNIPMFAFSDTSNVHYHNQWGVRLTNGKTLVITAVVNYHQQVHIADAKQYSYTASIVAPSGADGNQAVSIGSNTQATCDQSQAFGLGTITSKECQMVLGRYNLEEPDALLVVGNGENEFNRSNALVIDSKGFAQLKLDDGILGL